MNKKIIKEKLFPMFNTKDGINIYDKLMIDNDSVTYISIPNDAELIMRYIDKHCKYMSYNTHELYITDATAGVGGNVISFAKVFKHVNAIELDTQRYQYLCNNINAYEYNNVMCYNDDCLKLIYNLKTDIIFFDPPWGNYKEESKLRLKIGNEYIENICSNLINSDIKLITLKLPKNYDTDYMLSLFNTSNISIL